MTKKKKVVLKSFEELLNHEYGKIGTPKRDKYEKEVRKFIKSVDK